MKQIVHSILGNPVVFEWQQRLCNRYANLKKHFEDVLNVRGKDILDIGCSTGTCASSVLDMHMNRYVGIDIEKRYVDHATKRYPQGAFLLMDARAMEFPDNRFDIIMFVGALHHMPNDVIEDCFGQIRRVLRPEGVVLCAEPLMTPGKPISNFLLRHDRGKHIRDLAGYQSLFGDLHVKRRGYLTFAIHRFCSFVLGKTA